MCGIVGCYGGENIEKILTDKLEMLAYRGYDSAGVAVKGDGDIKATKEIGVLENLEKILKPLSGACLGIGHTRWATHGEPSIDNAHPHLSNDGNWAIVHNGIIENHSYIKKSLLSKGYVFKSKTDTETVAIALEDAYKEDNDVLRVFSSVCKTLEGSYAFGMITKYDGKLFFAKKKSPLYLAKNGGKYIMASDPLCFVGFSDYYYGVEDGEYGYFGADGLSVFNEFDQRIEKTPKKLTCQARDLTLDYPHYMIKEINESPKTIKNIVKHYSQPSALAFDEEKIKSIKRVKFVGCGSAYNAALIGAKITGEATGIDSEALVASEFRYSKPKLDGETLVVAVSQSGETADTLAAEELARKSGALTVAVVNVEYSTLSTKANVVMPILAGYEVSVVSTKSFVGQIATLYVLAQKLASIIKGGDFNLDGLKKLSSLLSTQDLPVYHEIANMLAKVDGACIIGRGYDYYTSLEVGLKLTETAYLRVNPYCAGELKHGFMTLINDNSIVAVFATDKELIFKTMSNAEETSARGAKLIICAREEDCESIKNKAKIILPIPSVEDGLQEILNVIPWQIICYHIAVIKGIDPDRPRNLAKSVTVE